MKKFFVAALFVLAVLAAGSFASADWFGSGFNRGITGFAVLGSEGSNAPAVSNANDLGQQVSANNQSAEQQLKQLRDQKKEELMKAITASRLAKQATRNAVNEKIKEIMSGAGVEPNALGTVSEQVKEVLQQAKEEIKDARQEAKNARALARETTRQKAKEIMAARKASNAQAIRAKKDAIIQSLRNTRAKGSSAGGSSVEEASTDNDGHPILTN